jgi:hypothetical protein
VQIGTIVTRSLLATVLVATVVAAGCAARQVRIAELRGQPERFDNETVRVTGTVTSSFGVPLLFQVYNLEDGSGEISVISMSGRTPATGTRLEVTGKVGEVIVLGGRSIGLHIREEDRRIQN